jgi:hypothetical protein
MASRLKSSQSPRSIVRPDTRAKASSTSTKLEHADAPRTARATETTTTTRADDRGGLSIAQNPSPSALRGQGGLSDDG